MRIDPDFFMRVGGSLSACQNWHTTSESDPPVQARQVEYRQYSGECSGHAVELEQWTIMTYPQIAFTHVITTSNDHQLAAEIVASATLPTPAGSERHFDVGYIRDVRKLPDGYHITVDRIVRTMQQTVINLNPATYDYALGPVSTVNWIQRHPGFYLPCGPEGSSTCQLSNLLRQFAKGPHPSDGSPAADGALTYITTNLDGNGSAVIEIYASS